MALFNLLNVEGKKKLAPSRLFYHFTFQKRIRQWLIALLFIFSNTLYAFEVDGNNYTITSETEKTVSFDGCNNSETTEVIIPESVIFEGNAYSVTSIEWGACRDYNNLNSIVIPNSVVSIKKYAFERCRNLKHVVIGSGTKEILDEAFLNCPIDYVEFHCTEIKEGWFEGYRSVIKHVNIGNGVTTVKPFAFQNWKGLESVQMANTVETIGVGAFWECENLTTVTLSSGLTKLEREIFCYCKSLSSISIPNSISIIEDRAFGFCKNLSALSLPSSVITIGSSAFLGCNSLSDITIPSTVSSIGDWAFCGCNSLTSIIIPKSVTSIGNYSFSSCYNIESISVEEGNPIYDSRDNCNCIIKTSENELIAGCYNSFIPNSITSIGIAAFKGCSTLTAISVPNSVTTIGAEAFLDCSSLTSISIPNKIKTIQGGTFRGCEKLAAISFPNSINEIGDYAFFNCRSLTSVTFPNSITSIGKKAFGSCVSLEKIVSLIEKPFSLEEAFISWATNIYETPLYIPIGTKKLYEAAEGWDFETKIEIAIDSIETDYGNEGEINDTTDLNGHVIGNIYYNISDENGEYSSAEGCIILRKPTTDEQMNDVVGMDLFGEDIKNNYTGIIFLVQAGNGTIKVNAETVGSMTLKVKIGNNQPVAMELEGKMKASFPYNVTEPTCVYIYGGETASANARGMRRAEATENALKIYGIEWSESDTPTHVEAIRETSSTDTPIYNLNGQRVESTSKGIYIKNGKKFLVK